MDELNNGTLTAAQRMRRLYWERKNNGLCTRCGKANKDGKAYCPECRAGKNEWRRQDRIFYAAHGLCTCCGKNIVFGEDRTCFECRAKDCVRRGRRDSDGMRKKNSEAFRRRCRVRSEQGLCVGCGRRKAAEGKKKCETCARRDTARSMKSYWKKKAVSGGIPRSERPLHGFCYICNDRLDRDGRVCSRCHERMKAGGGNHDADNYWKRDNEIAFRRNAGSRCDVATETTRRIFLEAPYAGAFGSCNKQG